MCWLQELDDRTKLIDRLGANVSAKEAEIADLRQQVAENTTLNPD